MSDKMTPEQRHFCMSQIKGKNTKPEVLVRKWLWHNGYRYRLNDKRLPGKPDIVLPKLKTVIFVNGCFWHGHDVCGNYRPPKSNTEFWTQKIKRNKARDSENHRQLKLAGWNVLVVWECQLKKDSRAETLYALTVNLSRILLAQQPHSRNYYEESPSTSQNVAEETIIYGKD